MWPFKKRQQLDYDPESDLSDDDATATMFIQQKAQIGSLFASRLSDPEEDYDTQRRHYENVRNDLIGWLDTIDDEFSRSFAAHCLIRMCLDGSDEAIARALFAGVRDNYIRERIVAECPVLGTDWRTTASQ